MKLIDPLRYPLEYLRQRFKRRYRVRITFKGGAILVAEFTAFDIKRDADTITNISWSQNRWCRNQLLHLSLQGIDAVDVLNP